MINLLNKIRKWHRFDVYWILTFLLVILNCGFHSYKHNTPPTPNIPLLEERIDINKIIEYVDPRIDPILSKEIGKAIEKYSSHYSLPPELIISIIKIESTFNPFATSKKEAKGLMQVLFSAHPKKIKGLKRNELYHIDNNIRIGCWIFKEYYEGDIEKTLSKYLGEHNDRYIRRILKTFTDITIWKTGKLKEIHVRNERIKKININLHS